jgi:hypothetical protein
MDAKSIASGGERKHLLIYGSMFFAVAAGFPLILVPVMWLDRPELGGPAESLPTLAACTFISGIFFSLPAFLFMLFVRRLRCVQYFAAVCGTAIAGAGVLGVICYSFPVHNHPFPWRTHRELLADGARGALLGFTLGLIAGSVITPLAFLVFGRSRRIPESVNVHPDESPPPPGGLTRDETDPTSIRQQKSL